MTTAQRIDALDRMNEAILKLDFIANAVNYYEGRDYTGLHFILRDICDDIKAGMQKP